MKFACEYRLCNILSYIFIIYVIISLIVLLAYTSNISTNLYNDVLILVNKNKDTDNDADQFYVDNITDNYLHNFIDYYMTLAYCVYYIIHIGWVLFFMSVFICLINIYNLKKNNTGHIGSKIDEVFCIDITTGYDIV